jgi:hypothetical protein
MFLSQRRTHLCGQSQRRYVGTHPREYREARADYRHVSGFKRVETTSVLWHPDDPVVPLKELMPKGYLPPPGR